MSIHTSHSFCAAMLRLTSIPSSSLRCCLRGRLSLCKAAACNMIPVITRRHLHVKASDLSTTTSVITRRHLHVKTSDLSTTTSVITRRHLHVKTSDLELAKVVLLCKVTRYEYEKHLHPDMSDAELEKHLTEKGSDFHSLKKRHEEYLRQVELIQEVFQKLKVEVQCVQKFDYEQQLVDWADAIFTAGGDGTFLMAASKVKGHGIPVIGINTDPIRSEGYLCLPKHYSTNLEEGITKIMRGEFKWQWRQRICITMSGQYQMDESVDLHQQQMWYPEHRSVEHVQENEMYKNSTLKEQPPTELPILALNEVFIGESISARVSFYQMSVDGKASQKQKSSGITVCTGTGSTSWFFNINHLSRQSVRDILEIAQTYRQTPDSEVPDDETLKQITDQFNTSLRFDPSNPRMAFCIRDPILNGVFQAEQPRGFCNSLTVLSRMWDGWVVVDGSQSFRFNDGAIATLSTREKDALRCVHLD